MTTYPGGNPQHLFVVSKIPMDSFPTVKWSGREKCNNHNPQAPYTGFSVHFLCSAVCKLRGGSLNLVQIMLNALHAAPINAARLQRACASQRSSNAASEELERATDALQSRASWKHRTPLYFTTRTRQARFNAFLDLSASSIVLKLVYSSCPHHGQQRGESWRQTVELERFYLQPTDGGIHRAHCEQLG